MFSAPTRMMKIHVLFAAAWCVHLTAGGNTSLRVFYCANPGCDTDVTDVFCNDESVFNNASLSACDVLPLPNTVCQRDGRAFVSIHTPGSCEFEGRSYIKTEQCTDDTTVCKFISATTSSPPITEDETPKNLILYIMLVVALLVVLLVLGFCAYKKKQNGTLNQQPDRDTQCELSRLENGHHLWEHDPGA